MAELSGVISSVFEECYSYGKEVFYKAILQVERMSGTYDEVPIVVSGNMLASEDYTNEFVYVTGDVRTYNKRNEDGSNSLIVHIFCKSFEVDADVDKGINVINLHGFICKGPYERVTPLGREITDFVLAVNRKCGKSNYIPCIAWGRNAKAIGKLNCSSEIEVTGRFQSRNYVRYSTQEARVAYEISVNALAIIDGK